MSVLINMEMPKTCEECALNYDSFACSKTGSRFFRGRETEFNPFKGRLEDCPLIPVPPHGRLGDLDALMRHCVMLPRDGGSLPVVYASYVRNAPTIIPAEEDTP